MSENKKPLAKIFNNSEEVSKWIKENPGIKIIGVKTSGSIEIYYEPSAESVPIQEEESRACGADPLPYRIRIPLGE